MPIMWNKACMYPCVFPGECCWITTYLVEFLCCVTLNLVLYFLAHFSPKNELSTKQKPKPFENQAYRETKFQKSGLLEKRAFRGTSFQMNPFSKERAYMEKRCEKNL